MQPTELEISRGKASEWIEIRAPCTMPDGYTFEATHNGQPFPVVVPAGGVVAGQIMTVPLVYEAELSRSDEHTSFIRQSIIAQGRVGAWKDGLFASCRFGPCHPSFLHALCCPQILMAQVLTRLKLDWLGERAPEQEWKKTFRIIAWIVVLYWVLTILFSPNYGEQDASLLQVSLYRILGWAFTIYTLVVLTKLRRHVRTIFDIPIRNRFFGQWEDVCLSCWCGLCVVSQLARQTCDYDEEGASCWSPTGLQSPHSVDTISVLTV